MIQHSQNSWASLIVLVAKCDGTLRFCELLIAEDLLRTFPRLLTQKGRTWCMNEQINARASM